jgi:hypothetical protein
MNRSKRAKRLGVRPVLWRFEMGGERKSGAAARALQDAIARFLSLGFMVPRRDRKPRRLPMNRPWERSVHGRNSRPDLGGVRSP